MEPTCIRTGAETTGRTVSKTVWTHATCLLVPNAARVQTTLMHRPDGDTTEAIHTPESPLSPPYPTKSPLWLFVSDCFWCFGVISSLLVFLCILTPSRYFSSLFLFQFIYFKLLEI